MAAVHDERAVVHASLRGRDEVEMVRPARPRCVDVCIGMEDGFQIFPFTRIPAIHN